MPSDRSPAESTPSRAESIVVQAGSRPTPMPDDDWVAAHYRRIHRAAWLMTGDVWEAEDLAQETFVVAIERWERFDGRSSRATWLYGILIRLRRRRARTLARLRRRLAEYVARKTPNQTLDPKAEFAYSQWCTSVWADVATLPEAQREAVLLRFAEEMTYEEIAKAVGCAVGTAKTRVHHGLKRLRRNNSNETLAIPVNRPIELHTVAKQ